MAEELKVIFEFILKLIKEYGLLGVLIFIALLLIQDPDRIIKLKSFFWKMIYRSFKKGKRKYIGSNIIYRLNKFFNEDHLNRAFGEQNLRFQVKWVKKVNDPILKENGTIILNLESSNDQTRNILKATQVSLPLIFCSSLRKSLKKDYQDAIDFTIMKKMADQIGKNAYPVFEKYFLAPGAESKPELLNIYKELVRIDAFGIFVSIFITEINILASRFYAEAMHEDISEDIRDFISYLLTIAERDKGEEIELIYIRKYFKIGFILVAKKLKVVTEGAIPYIERLARKFNFGCEKVFLIGFASNTIFFHELYSLLKSDLRYTASPVEKMKSISKERIAEFIEILSIEKNNEQDSDKFNRLIDYHNLKKGMLVSCQLLETTQDLAIFDLRGLSGFLYSKYCSWSRKKACSDMFVKNKEYSLKIIDINFHNERVILTNRNDTDNPLLQEDSPVVGDVINVELNIERKDYYIGISKNDYEIIIPKEELSWTVFEDYSKYHGKRTNVIVYQIVFEDGLLFGSIKRNLKNPWTNINSVYPRGSVVKAEIQHVNEYGVYLILPNGLVGLLRHDKIIQSESDVKFIKGTKIDVIIEKIIAQRNKIYLNLPR